MTDTPRFEPGEVVICVNDADIEIGFEDHVGPDQAEYIELGEQYTVVKEDLGEPDEGDYPDNEYDWGVQLEGVYENFGDDLVWFHNSRFKKYKLTNKERIRIRRSKRNE